MIYLPPLVPRQIDIEARSLARETRAGVDRGDFKLSKKTIGAKTSNQKSLPIPALLNLTGNFLSPESLDTKLRYSISICISLAMQVPDFRMFTSRLCRFWILLLSYLSLSSRMGTSQRADLFRFLPYVHNYYTIPQTFAI